MHSPQIGSQIPWNSRLANGSNNFSDYAMAQQTSINNALSTILGYLGAEVATEDIFERLLWPERFYNGFDIHKIPKLALFLPMGGPLHKAALQTMDHILQNDLFKGREQGHMLGSPFYRDTHAEYTSHDVADPSKKEKEYPRNGLWLRAIVNMPIPYATLEDSRRGMRSDSMEGIKTPARIVRGIHTVSHLKISIPDNKPLPSKIIGDEIRSTSWRTYLALVLTESTGIAVGFSVMLVWRSWFMILWFIPLLLKVLSAFLALSRDPLEIPTSCTAGNQSVDSTITKQGADIQEKPSVIPGDLKRFEIHNLKHGFLIIEGEEQLLLQFFRHYGHPIRNYFRERAQFLIIILFGCLFPVGLLCSLLWMPVGLQYVWMGYQLYATFAMHVYRYTGGHTWATTEEHIAQKFGEAIAKDKPPRIYFGNERVALAAELEVTYHDRFRDGKKYMEAILSRDTQKLGRSISSSTSVSSSETLMNENEKPQI